MQVSGRAADLATDVLGAAGVGHPSYADGHGRLPGRPPPHRRRQSADVAGTTAPADDTAGEATHPAATTHIAGPADRRRRDRPAARRRHAECAARPGEEPAAVRQQAGAAPEVPA